MSVRRRLLQALIASLVVTSLVTFVALVQSWAFGSLVDRAFGPLPAAPPEEPVTEPGPSASPPSPPPAPPAPRRSPPPVPKLVPREAASSAPAVVPVAPPLRRERIAFAPHTENGKVTGLRFSGGPSGTLFDLLGLKHGDILQSINGYSMNDPEEGLRAYSMLRRAPLFRVKLLREGRPVEIVIHVL